jgi:hypothetical protein
MSKHTPTPGAPVSARETEYVIVEGPEAEQRKSLRATRAERNAAKTLKRRCDAAEARLRRSALDFAQAVAAKESEAGATWQDACRQAYGTLQSTLLHVMTVAGTGLREELAAVEPWLAFRADRAIQENRR